MRNIHLVCNAHLDPVWQWEWEEGAAAAISTFRTAADLAEEFEGFIFNHNEALLYRWVEEYEPELFARIQRLVREGKWHIMGGWYLQPDCNMPSGESFVRQILLGKSYFEEKFYSHGGPVPTTAINFDPFGHTQGLVQILAKSGYDSYIVCRPDSGNCPLPAETFWWEGYDGSRILVVRGWGGYLAGLGKARKKVEDYIAARPEENISLVLWGVGNHGGGPSRQDLLALKALMDEKNEFEIRHSTPEAYFSGIKENANAIPVHRGDLNPWGVGCYTSQVRIKQKHRLLENELFSAEKMATIAWSQGRMDYPADELREVLFDLATGQFHDILPGSSIQPVEEMALRLFDHGLEILSRVKARAFFALASGQPAAPEGEIPILVYNPHPYPVQAIVECEFMLADQNWEDNFTIAAAYRDGELLPSQIEQELGNINLDWRKRVVFSTELAPAQMNRFDCRLERLPARPRPSVLPEGKPFIFRNERFQAVINTQTGWLDRYQVDGVEILTPEAGKCLIIADSPDPWGMTVRSFREVVGAFSLLSPEETARFAGVPLETLSPVRIIEDGPVRTVVEALFGYLDSRLCLRYKLPQKGAEIELEVIVHWNEKDRMLKLSLPTALTDSRLLGQVAYGTARLPTNGDEVVAQKWAAVVSGANALTVINDGTYGLDFEDDELRLSLLRSPAYTAHPINDRPIMPLDRYSPRQEQGARQFHFWLHGGPTQERLEKVDRAALAHSERPMALSFFPNGTGPILAPGVTLSDSVIQVTAVKKAEKSPHLILRLFEPTGHPRATTISLPFAHLSHTITLQGFEIVTLQVDLVTGQWIQLGLLENPLEHKGA